MKTNESFINRQTIERIINRDYANTTCEVFRKSVGNTNFVKRLVIKIDKNTHFVISNNGEPQQSCVIATHGNLNEIKKVLKENGFNIIETSEKSYKFVNNFINKINDLIVEPFPYYEQVRFDYNETQKAGSYNFKVTIKKILFIQDETTIVERFNCELNIIKGDFLESVKFKIHNDEFIRGNYKQNINDVNFDFFNKIMKRIFLNSYKDMIQSSGLADNYTSLKPNEIDDVDYDMLKETIKMILI